MQLTRDFAKAAGKLRTDMKVLERDNSVTMHIPAANFRQWDGTNNNCYNFALNRKTNDFLQPGKISFQMNPQNFFIYRGVESAARFVHDCAIEDGLRYLGHDFLKAAEDCTAAETPIALFIKDETDDYDFHWLAPRETEGRMIWAHKMGHQNAGECRLGIRGIFMRKSIFSVAALEGYDYFSGYYAAPRALERVPREIPVLTS